MVKNHRKITLDHLNYLKMWEKLLIAQRVVAVGKYDGTIESVIEEEEKGTSPSGHEEKRRRNNILDVDKISSKSRGKPFENSTKPRIVGVVVS